RRELSYQTEQEMRERHPERALEESLYRKEISAKAGIEFTRRNENLAAESKVANRESNYEAEERFRARYPMAVRLCRQ
ncbi:hypothetical protein, partial [Muribaculum intestinale]|uniref:hypothetical protein n=1 Tax=Muribaculum intestinale TaxID=1796646 RepID=UPI0026E09845